MNDDLISRNSMLDYIENEIAKVKGTEALCVLRALSVHVSEYEPTAYELDKVMKELGELKASAFDDEVVIMREAIEIVKAGGV